ncbi:MAG: hypothetical protein CMJ39_12875 [Phycisphaerae bacterium]|nr:hypothetical protein [Phycisphaerae bacterium]
MVRGPSTANTSCVRGWVDRFPFSRPGIGTSMIRIPSDESEQPLGKTAHFRSLSRSPFQLQPIEAPQFMHL